jgi:hypothetical protein
LVDKQTVDPYEPKHVVGSGSIPASNQVVLWTVVHPNLRSLKILDAGWKRALE